jgi:dipeptidyl aminopeptidase/acylaminoacyl peptidase
MRKVRTAILYLLVVISSIHSFGQEKPRITLDEFFNAVSISKVRTAPDGKAVLIATERADWDNNRFREDIWLYREGASSLLLLTQSGHDSNPQWSPDGHWIAFLSDRKSGSGKSASPAGTSGSQSNRDESESKDKEVTQVYLVSLAGGEAFPVTSGDEEVHSFTWAADSQAIYFATRAPWSKAQQEANKKHWNDVVRFREAERGDVLYRISLAGALATREAVSISESKGSEKDKDQEAPGTAGAKTIAASSLRIQELIASPDGKSLAFLTNPVSQRQEYAKDYEIYTVDFTGGPARQLTRNNAIEEDLHWSGDSRQIFFTVRNGGVEAAYGDFQDREYSVEIAGAAVHRWAEKFPGAVASSSVTAEGDLLSAGRLGTEVQVYTQAKADAPFAKHRGWSGAYTHLSAAAHSPRVAFVFSSLGRPEEVYLAESVDALTDARPITTFNKLFIDRALPEGKPYRWKSADGTTIEGMLIYPPGKMGSKNLRTLVLIHGGPADADGNVFGADWYDWGILAASNDWLVFRPNYRGSSGYGDKFLREIIPTIVSRPGKDILEGVDALVRDDLADPDRLAIGGYSYGGYMTNWLITQTTRFKAAVSGAGAVEHASNWGNDDTTMDDAFFLGGRPWEAVQRYIDEAALYQFGKVKTPTHIVAGADDVRVAVSQDYLLERALHSQGIPSRLLIFPGEGHSLSKNPWHGKIKVREELLWLEQHVPK